MSEKQEPRMRVTLRDGQVRVDRRTVDREVTAEDMPGMKDGVIEVTEIDEEAVVSKQARVVEEVVVGQGHRRTRGDRARNSAPDGCGRAGCRGGLEPEETRTRT